MRQHERHGAGVFAGLLFLALGVILLIGNMGLFPVQPLVSLWWPVILIVIGVKQLIVLRGPSSWIGGLFWIGTGALFLSSTLGYMPISISGMLWPVMLIWFGVWTLMGRNGRCAGQMEDGSHS